MRRDLEAVRNSDNELNAAPRKYSVPKATLKRLLDGKNYFAVGNIQVIGSVGDIPPDVEEELINHILQLEQRIFGTTVTYLRRLVFQIAELIHFSRRFSKNKEISGKKWYYEFMRRHP
jgi:hypothetical protein